MQTAHHPIETGHHTLNEFESKQLLKTFGIPVAPEIIAQTLPEALAAAEKTGYPIVVKGMGTDIAHKTERGLVRLNIRDAGELENAMESIFKSGGPDVSSILIQPMQAGKREFVAGLFRDHIFGPVIMFGLGGIYTEALHDVTFRLAPLTSGEANRMVEEIRASRLLQEFRGEAAVNRDQLIAVLTGLSDLSLAHPEIAEVDINPLMANPDGRIMAVDALVVKSETVQNKTSRPSIDPDIVGALFYPKSIAFVGASGQIGKWGYTLLTNVIGGGYKGKVHLVNPKGGTIAGRPVYKSVADIPDQVDVAVVTIPAAAVPDMLPQLAAKNISSMLLIASGFSETGPEGREKEVELVALARKYGIAVLGPNTMGICNPHIHFYCTGTHVRPQPGSTSIVAQSGNMGNQLLAFAELQGIGVRGFCGSGNEAMITIEDYLDAFAVDPLTKTIMLYIESVKNGRRFFESASALSREKPIVLLKGGQTEAGSKAASSHTGAMTSDTRVFNAVCRQAGIVQVDKPMDLLDLSAAFSSLPLPAGDRVAIMTLGGGWGVVAADLCEAHGLRMASLSEDILSTIDAILPPYWSRANPIDLVGENDMTIPLTVLEALAQWDGCDAIINLGIMGRRHIVEQLTASVLVADTTYTPALLEQIKEGLVAFEEKYVHHIVTLMEKYHKPIIGVAMLKDEKDRTVYALDGHDSKGVFFPAPEQAVQSLAKMVTYAKFLDKF